MGQFERSRHRSWEFLTDYHSYEDRSAVSRAIVRAVVIATVGTMPIHGRVAFHLRCLILGLGDVLLDRKRFVAFVVFFIPEIGQTAFLILVGIEGFVSCRDAVDLIRGSFGIEFFLLCRLRRTFPETSGGEEVLGVGGSRAGAADEEEDRQGGNEKMGVAWS